MGKAVDAPEYALISEASEQVCRKPARNLAGVSEAEATGEVAALYDHFRSRFGRPDVPGILQCFATHPALLRGMMEMSGDLIFSEGALGRRAKELIATMVSSHNECAYCADSHGFFLRMHGGTDAELAAVAAGEMDGPMFSARDRALLTFAHKVSEASQAIGPADIEGMRAAGWSDLQIAEAIHVTALFATYNRVANAFGLESQGLLSLAAKDREEEV